MSRELRIKGGEKILAIIRKFSATEKAIFAVLVVIALLSALFLAWTANKSFLTPIPAKGGIVNEGTVGLPRSVNPVLAFTDVDNDLSNLIYAGLMKYEDGKIVPDLASKYNVSDDGLTYTFTLKDDVRFQDGVQLTTDDVEFTIQKIQDATIKSPRRADWANITIKKNSPTEIQFILKQPYSPFLANATIGIIPKHIWNKIEADQFIYSQYNVEPIGSGPYKLRSIQKDNDGIPLYYSLVPFDRYHGKEAYISELRMYFYPTERSVIEAYSKGTIEAAARISPDGALKIASTSPSAKILHTPLPRIFGVFFNQNQAPIFTKNEVRQALDMATDRERIINEVLLGYGVESTGPIPSDANIKTEQDIEGAKALLQKAGWSLNEDGIMEKKDKTSVQTLEFSIATADSPDLKQVADILKEEWQKIGANVTVKVFEYGDLYQNIISTRKYDALLFGESIGKDLDLYAFWHSSQRNSPGLNVAMYVNSKADKLLEQARVTQGDKDRNEIYSQFEKVVEDEVPAIFLYSPDFIYVIPDRLKGVDIEKITTPSDRFYEVTKWYVKTENVWKIFDENNP